MGNNNSSSGSEMGEEKTRRRTAIMLSGLTDMLAKIFTSVQAGKEWVKGAASKQGRHSLNS
jgi:hypothetical protein